MVVDTHQGDDSFERMKEGKMAKIMWNGIDHSSFNRNTEMMRGEAKKFTIADETAALTEIMRVALDLAKECIGRGAADLAHQTLKVYQLAKELLK